MLLLSIVLLLAALIGYLSQNVGLCLVRGVALALKKRFSLLFATLLSGAFSWLSTVIGKQFGLVDSSVAYEANWWVVLGGFVFGIGAAVNHACTLSTLNRLMRGDIRMLATLIGWVLGWWCITKLSWNLPLEIHVVSKPSQYWILLCISLLILVWAAVGDASRKHLWFSISSIGLLAGILFLYQPSWPPSVLLSDISKSLGAINATVWPTLERYFLFASLLMGMFYAAYSKQDFYWVKPKWLHWPKHLVAGTLMGFGSSFALGGNDAQLLIALPNFSIAGVAAISAMLCGIALVLKFNGWSASRTK